MGLQRYELIRKLGEGGMGEVYEGVHVHTGRRVAIKKLRAEALGAPTMLDRFLLEARAACAVRHPNVVEVFDVGVEADEAFMVLELLEGRSLEQELQAVGRLSPTELARIVPPLLDALGAAHARGILHRDIKPANVFLARQPDGKIVPKLLDFGIARFVRSDDVRVTRTGHLLGTPLYMSPEQAQARKDLDARADLYSFAVLCYEALAGRPPFAEETLTALLLAITSRDPPPIEGVSEAIDSVVRRAMSRDRDARPSSAAELRDVLVAALSSQAAPALASTFATQPTLADTPRPVEPEPSVTVGTSSRRWLAPALAVLVVGFVAAGALVWGRDSTLPETPGPAPVTSTEPPIEVVPTPVLDPAPLGSTTVLPEPSAGIEDAPTRTVEAARTPSRTEAREDTSRAASRPVVEQAAVAASAPIPTSERGSPPEPAEPEDVEPTTSPSSSATEATLRVTGARTGELSVDEF